MESMPVVEHRPRVADARRRARLRRQARVGSAAQREMIGNALERRGRRLELALSTSGSGDDLAEMRRVPLAPFRRPTSALLPMLCAITWIVCAGVLMISHESLKLAAWTR